MEAAHLDVAVLAQASGEAGAVAHGAFAEGETGGEVELAAEGVDVDEETGVVAVEVEAGVLVAPDFGAVVADGGAAQAHAEVGIEAVADAHAKALGAACCGKCEVRSRVLLFNDVDDFRFSGMEDIVRAEQGEEKGRYTRHG